MNKIYVVMQYILDTGGNPVGNEPVVAYETEDAALDFMDTFNLGDEIVEVSFGASMNKKFTDTSKVVYSGNADAASHFLEGFFTGKIGKVPRQ